MARSASPWNVPTRSLLRVSGVVTVANRSLSSSAALRLNVVTTIRSAGTIPASANLAVSATTLRVLPEPAAATTRQLPSEGSHAATWA